MDNIDLDIQIRCQEPNLPDEEEIATWVAMVLGQINAEVTLRLVDEEEGAYLNEAYRGKKGPTNILSFALPSIHDPELLQGDLVICIPLIQKEATAQGKAFKAHFAHLIIHGLLHLQGYQHDAKDEAAIMEEREIQFLSIIGMSNPYE